MFLPMPILLQAHTSSTIVEEHKMNENVNSLNIPPKPTLTEMLDELKKVNEDPIVKDLINKVPFELLVEGVNKVDEEVREMCKNPMFHVSSLENLRTLRMNIFLNKQGIFLSKTQLKIRMELFTEYRM